MRNRLLALALLAGLATSAQAADDSGATQPATQPTADAKPTRAQVVEYLKMNQELAQILPLKKWEQAAAICQRQIELLPGVPDAYYKLACADARLEKADDAIAALQKALQHGFAAADQMASDDDLTSLHSDKRFAALVAQAKANEKNAPFEHGGAIPGVKTFESLPDGGLRYRARYSPAATAKAPQKLIVWLHPSGGSMDNVVEALAPMFNKHGYALIVFTQKRYDGWTAEDFNKAMNKSLPDLAKHVPEIDVRKPIIMGFSAGGQMAIMAYSQTPHGFSGVILDAAYPITMAATGYTVMPPPKDPSIRLEPIYSICGEKDGGFQVWKRAEPLWLAAGIPLTVRYVPNAGHQWLFDQAHLTELAAWLDKVHAGKLPADPAPATQPTTRE